MLQPVDIAVAYLAAYQQLAAGWSPARVQRDLQVPWSSLNLSLGRLSDAGVVRGGRPSRQALATLLPALQSLLPIGPSDGVATMGVPTGASSPGLGEQLVVAVPQVWAHSDGRVRGVAVQPLFRTIPDIALHDEGLHRLFGALDAARSGRAREYRLAREVLAELTGLPEPMAA